jgi:hypothetical protein
MQDFYKSYDSLAEAAQEIFEANTSDYEKKYGGRILQKLSKRKGKLVTNQQWDKADKDQRAVWLGKLPYSNPDDVARYIGVRWKDLPSLIQNNMFESKEELEENRDDFSEDEIYEEAIAGILEDESLNIQEISDEEIEKVLEDKFNSLSEAIVKYNESELRRTGRRLKKAASLLTVSGRAARAQAKVDKGEKKRADREKLAKAKETLKKQKALRRAQKMAKRAGKPVPLSYADAGIKETEELDEEIPPLLVSILKTAAIGAGKALLKGLLDKAEKQKISPREYEKASSNFDKNGTFDKLKSADARYRAAERGGRNPFDRGTLAYELFNDLGEGVETEEETPL